MPEVTVTHEVGLKKYRTGNVCTLNKDNYENIIFYIHGGSFTFEISHLHVEFCDLLADPLNAKVYMPLYPCALRQLTKKPAQCFTKFTMTF